MSLPVTPCLHIIGIFTSRSARAPAGTYTWSKDCFTFSAFVCFVRPHLSRAQYVTSYVTKQLQCMAAFGGLQGKLQQMKVIMCCPEGENLVGSRKYPVSWRVAT